MQIRTIIFIIFAPILLCNCATYDFSRPVVQQGTMLQKNKISQLKLGMSKSEVAAIMGTSLINPPFATDRWDYAFTMRNRGGKIKVINLSLYFKNDKLSSINYNRN